jgi:hypothetical protein
MLDFSQMQHEFDRKLGLKKYLLENQLYQVQT